MRNNLLKRHRAKLEAAAILLVTLVAYAPVLGGGFVWDDAAHLLENIVLEENGLYRAWLTTESLVYYPVVWTSYWIEYQLWGFDPRGYHVVNVLLHAANSLFVWRILLRLRVPGAWVAALLFALHPVNVESAAWITQRKNTLCFLFYALSLLLVLRYEDGDRRSSATYGGAVACFALSMLSKGAAVAMPAIVLLLAWWRRGRIARSDVLDSLAFFAVAFGISLLEIGFQYGSAIAGDEVRPEGFLSRLAGAGWVAGFYLAKALVPIQLSFVYPRWDIDPGVFVSWLPTLAFAGALYACWHTRARWGRGPGVALLYFLLALAPVLGFFDFYYMLYSLVGDHYQYVAVVAVVALGAGSATALASQSPPAVRRAWLALAAIVIAGFFVSTWQRSAVFADSDTLWRDTIAKNPDAFLAHYNLGLDLQKRGELAAAAEHYRSVLRVRPDSVRAHNNLGSVLLKLDDLPGAMAAFERAVESDPARTEGHNNLGNALRKAGRVEEALPHYRSAIALSPDAPAPRINLANALKQLGRDEEANEVREGARRAKANRGKFASPEARSLRAVGRESRESK